MSWDNQAYKAPKPTSSWGMVTAAAVVTLIALLLLVPLVYDQTSGGYLAGQLSGAAVIGWLVVGIVAQVTKGNWPRWLPASATVVAIVFVAGLTLARTSVQASPDEGTAAVPGGQSHTLAAPAKLGLWQKSDDAAQTAFETGVASMEKDLADQGVVVGGVYQHGGDRMIFIGVNVAEGSQMADQLHSDPSATLADYASGIGVDGSVPQDAGELGGLMSCGTVTAQSTSTPLVACTWADEDTVATVLLGDQSPVTASRLTRQIRAAATTVSD